MKNVYPKSQPIFIGKNCFWLAVKEQMDKTAYKEMRLILFQLP